MSTNPEFWKQLLNEVNVFHTLSITFKVGGGREDGKYRAAIGRFNGYAQRKNIVITLMQDEITLARVCSTGEWPGEMPIYGHRIGIEFTVHQIDDINKFVNDIEPAVESIKRVQVELGI